MTNMVHIDGRWYVRQKDGSLLQSRQAGAVELAIVDSMRSQAREQKLKSLDKLLYPTQKDFA